MSGNRCQLEFEASRLDGLFEGLCKPEEYKHLIEAGLLRRTYDGASGFMGLAKLRKTEETPTPARSEDA